MRFTFFSLLASLLILGCGQTRKAIADIQPQFLANYSINPYPNNLDSVGIVFSVDAKGAKTTVANLNLPINADSITVPQEVNATNLSFKVLLDFLSVKNLDSSAKVALQDSVKLNTSFVVSTGVYSRFDPNTDLLAKFNERKPTMISNIKLLGLEKNKLYLIVEAIKSNEVNLFNMTSTKFNFNAGATFKKLIQLNPGAGISKAKTNSLNYSTNVPRVIFYKLRPVDIDKTKGPQGESITISLGKEETVIITQ